MLGDTDTGATIAGRAAAAKSTPPGEAAGRARGKGRRWLRERVLRALLASLPPLEARLRRRAVEAVVEHLLASSLTRDTPAALAFALARSVDARLASLRALEHEQSALLAFLRAAPTEQRRRAELASYLRRTRGAAAAAGDLSALGRWFDVEALAERFAARSADLLDEIAVTQRAFAACVANAEPTIARALKEVGVVDALLDHAGPGRRPVVRAGALKALAGVVERVARAERPAYLAPDAAYRVLAWASGEGATRWVQVAALEVSAALFPDDLCALARARLARRQGRDDLIVRANALRLLARQAPPGALDAALEALRDPSEHVRQTLAGALASLPGPPAVLALAALAADDPSERVAGYALRELVTRALEAPDACPAASDALVHAAAAPTRPLVARVALASVKRLAGAGASLELPRLVDALVRLAGDERTPPALAEEATATLRWLEVHADPALRTAREAFSAALGLLREGQRARVPAPAGLGPEGVERALGAATRGDLAVSLGPARAGSLALVRGEPRRLRLWRLLHELKHPMPDKRKGFVHTRGRAPAGHTVFAPAGTAEVTPTRVPGERRLHPAAGGWGPFVPRVDDLLAVCGLYRRTLRVLCAFGALTLRSPASWRARARARRELTLRYAEFDRARSRSLDAAEPDERLHYARLVTGLGIDCAFEPARGQVAGTPYEAPSWLPARYVRVASAAGAFCLALPPGDAPALAERWPDLSAFASYALSPVGNSALELAWLAWLVFAFVVARAAWSQRGIERARRSVPLTVGGWGTRGKSGTERLKAALFHALRYDVVVKTTGCEAMFIHAMRDVPAQEIFLYRPYDKATVWEQRDVLRTASSLRAQVFLWECMALQPRLVETLENEWMLDGVTTLTNAYPDHEDVQGPSGEDVARVIGRFMPRRGLTLTTEEQMLPLLAEAARDKGARLRAVDPLEADLLPEDLLARFPYQEHPRNIALTLALAEHFGIDREFALVEMADHVVPDLGVLKTYPTVEHRGRSLSFSNGMSANERAGFLSNWTRLGFDREPSPGDFVVLVVNNRADRVARSRVFAHILTDDVSADSIVLINTNLEGMLQLIDEALEAKLSSFSLAGVERARALGRVDRSLAGLGAPAESGALGERVARMLGALAPGADFARPLLAEPALAQALARGVGFGEALAPALEARLGPADEASARARAEVVAHAARLGTRFAEGDGARRRVAAALDRGDAAAAEAVWRDTYRSLFRARLAVVWDAHATGDQVIDFVTGQVPPGHHARIVGCQNIKGAGLDFVYRWLSVERVRHALGRLRDEPEARPELLGWLASYADFGLLDCREALATLREVRAQAAPEWAELTGALDAALDRLEVRERELASGLVASEARGGALKRAADAAERFVDHWDSIRRGARARRVLRDLYAARIGHGRAARLLRDVTTRAKGGWLYESLRTVFGRRPREAGPARDAGSSPPNASPP